MTTHAHLSTSASLAIPTDRFADPILRFVAASPLAACTSVGYDGGARIVRTDRPLPMLSDGEKRVWGLLDSLCRGELRDFLTGVDNITVAAFGDLIARVCLAMYGEAL